MPEMTVTEKLLKIKEKVEAAEREEAQLQGRLSSAYERLKKEFGLTTLQAAEKKLAEMDKDLIAREEQLNQNVNSLVTAYDWGF